MSCPEDLVVRARRGALSADECAELDAHVSGCADCRLLLRLGRDLDEELEPAPGDALIAARIAKKLASKVAATPRRTSPAVVVLVAAAILAFAALAAASSLGLFPFTTSEVAPPSTPPPPPRPAPVVTVEAPTPPETPDTVEAVEPREDEAAPERPAPTAAELFADGNAQRREGEPARARALYRELQRRYPRSPEAIISHVSLGRVLLELDDVDGALDQFDDYLARSPRGALAEEARFGRASALGRLGRSAEERRAWQDLLEAFPSSVYAERARARLGTP